MSAIAEIEEKSEIVAEYQTRGFIALRGVFSAEEVQGWQSECDRLLGCDWAQAANIRTPFRMDSGDVPERIDPVVDVSPLFQKLVRDERITGIVSAIFGDEALLFKDKLIFKAPGTQGYTMHQDQSWWQLCEADDILSVSIQIDGADAENGCVELFEGYHRQMLTPAGVMRNFEAEELAQVDAARGEKIETQPGDVLIFHSLAPHKSARNTSQQWRRSLYLSYNAARAGDLHAQYYEDYKTRVKEGDQFFR